MRSKGYYFVLCLLVFFGGLVSANTKEAVHTDPDYDLIIYGASSSGIMAGVQARREGLTVLVIEPSNTIGSLTASGLGEVPDRKLKSSGLAAEFFQSVEKYYQADAAWNLQDRVEYQFRCESRTTVDRYQLWAMEPKIAKQVFDQFITDEKLNIRTNARLDRSKLIEFTDDTQKTIKTIYLESGEALTATYFIDATYEGDLMVAAGLKYTYVTKSNAPHLHSFRLLVTDDPRNRVAFEKPDNYSEYDFTDVLKKIQDGSPWTNSHVPNNKYYVNNLEPNISFDPEAFAKSSYAERKQAITNIKNYQPGVLWTLANHPKSSRRIRSFVSSFGWCKDEYLSGKGLPSLLYTHPLRQLTNPNLNPQKPVTDPIGLSYAENNSQLISLRSIHSDSISNLLVTICSANPQTELVNEELGETILMNLGQAGALVIKEAIEQKQSITKIDYEKLKLRLAQRGISLEAETPSKPIAGIVVDESEAILTGLWIKGELKLGVKEEYLHDDANYQGNNTAVFKTQLPSPGKYEVQVSYPALPTRATNVPVLIKHADGKQEIKLNQQVPPPIDDLFTSVGEFEFKDIGCVTISNQSSNGSVVIDAVRWLAVQ